VCGLPCAGKEDHPRCWVVFVLQVMLKMYETGEAGSLLPVVAQVLQFSPEEARRCRDALHVRSEQLAAAHVASELLIRCWLHRAKGCEVVWIAACCVPAPAASHTLRWLASVALWSHHCQLSTSAWLCRWGGAGGRHGGRLDGMDGLAGRQVVTGIKLGGKLIQTTVIAFLLAFRRLHGAPGR
jgi:hypothetical protein